MALSSSQFGPQLYTATWMNALNTGGVTEDVQQFAARDDRRIVAAHLSVNGDQGFAEVSFSSESNLAGGAFDEDRSGTIIMGHDSVVVFDEDQWMQWGEGEELHVHERNNTGANIDYVVTIYYVDEDDC